VGGHFPSFDPETVLKVLPGADSIIPFEGEATIVELLACLGTGRDWRGVSGLAARLDDGKIKTNCLRPKVPNLDELP
jgi:anaerobic magnesium-protoporphyrin IX monomethyl ester cyclase